MTHFTRDELDRRIRRADLARQALRRATTELTQLGRNLKPQQRGPRQPRQQLRRAEEAGERAS